MRIPKHIGVIPDGNRRWAKAHGMNKADGYAYGLEPGLKLLRHVKALGVEEITFYGFTVDNCKRPKQQEEAFQRACVEAVKLISEDGVDLLVVGNGMKSKTLPWEAELKHCCRVFCENIVFSFREKNGIV